MSLARIKNLFEQVKQDNTLEEEFDLGGVKFGVTILTRDEEIKAQTWAETFNTSAYSNPMRLDVAKLSYAIRSIAKEPIPEFLDSNDGAVERHIFLKEILMDMPSILIDALLVKYNLMRTKLKEKLGMQTVSIDSLFSDLEKSTQALSNIKKAEEFDQQQIDQELMDQIPEQARNNIQ